MSLVRGSQLEPEGERVQEMLVQVQGKDAGKGLPGRVHEVPKMWLGIQAMLHRDGGIRVGNCSQG